MGILLKIVYRNLKEHKVKTLIIGIIMAFGMYILIAGNSIIDTVTAGISKNFVEYNSGHIAVFPSSLENPSLTGDGPGMDGDSLVPIIANYEAVADHVAGHPKVVKVSPQINGTATMQFDEEGSGFGQLLAVEPDLYTDFFPNAIELTKGRFLRPGEEGIVLSEQAVEFREDSSGETVEIGDSVILTGMSQISGIKIREVSVVGIYGASIASQMMTSYVDSENLRALNGMTQITDVAAVLTEEEQSDLGSVDEDDLFGGSSDFLVVEESLKTEREEDIFSVFGGSGDRELYNAIDPNAWHYLLLRLENESQIRGVVLELNTQFENLGLEVKAYSWLDASGQVAEMTTALRLIFNVIIIIIAIVAVIIIMNTLVISVTERIGEIGTMRAIGAQKSFVRRMIILETIIIVLVFGGAGILLGGLTIIIVGAVEIETEDIIIQMLAGGSIIRPIISLGSVLVSLFGMLAAGIFASLYPASLALRIEPRQAMASR